MIGFGNAVLVIEECIMTFMETYCRTGAYPEDLPLFTELGEATHDELSLAASFVQSYIIIYAVRLLDELAHVESSLASLEHLA